MFAIMFFFYIKHFTDLSKSAVLILDIVPGNRNPTWEISFTDKNMQCAMLNQMGAA